jgi:antitoxin VapB
MDETRNVKLFRNGRNQAVRIPREFELPGEDAVMRKVGNQLIIEAPKRKMTLSELLDTFETIDEPFPDIKVLPSEPLDRELFK